jgi:hypothetical protein
MQLNLPMPARILYSLLLTTLVAGVVRLIWRRDWSWLRASGVLFLVMFLLWTAFLACGQRLARLNGSD